MDLEGETIKRIEKKVSVTITEKEEVHIVSSILDTHGCIFACRRLDSIALGSVLVLVQYSSPFLRIALRLPKNLIIEGTEASYSESILASRIVRVLNGGQRRTATVF